MCRTNEDSWAQEQATKILIEAGLHIHNFANATCDDEAFLGWICSTAKELVCCDAVTVHWVDEKGRLPKLSSTLVQAMLSPVVRCPFRLSVLQGISSCKATSRAGYQHGTTSV